MLAFGEAGFPCCNKNGVAVQLVFIVTDSVIAKASVYHWTLSACQGLSFHSQFCLVLACKVQWVPYQYQLRYFCIESCFAIICLNGQVVEWGRLSVDRLNEAGCQWTGQVMVSPIRFGCSLCLALWQSLVAPPGEGSTGRDTPLCSLWNNGPCWIMEIRNSQPANRVRSSSYHDYWWLYLTVPCHLEMSKNSIP